MDSFEITSLVGFLFSLWRLWFGVLSFDPAVYQFAIDSFAGSLLALVTLVIAGVSLQMGQSVVLFANRVPLRRFAASLTMGIVWLGISTVFWVITIWLSSRVITGNWLPLGEILILVSLAVTPLVFGFLILLPYLGNLLYYLFFTWIFVNVLVGLNALHGFNLWQSIFCTGIGWLAIFLFTRSRILSLEPVERWIWRTATGIPTQMEPDDLAEQFAREFGANAVEISHQTTLKQDEEFHQR